MVRLRKENFKIIFENIQQKYWVFFFFLLLFKYQFYEWHSRVFFHGHCRNDNKWLYLRKFYSIGSNPNKSGSCIGFTFPVSVFTILKMLFFVYINFFEFVSGNIYWWWIKYSSTSSCVQQWPHLPIHSNGRLVTSSVCSFRLP